MCSLVKIKSIFINYWKISIIKLKNGVLYRMSSDNK